MDSNAVIVMYLMTYFRRVMFGIFLCPSISGYTQIFLLIVLNFTQIVMLVYVVVNKLYTGKLKIITRLVNVVSILGIQFLTWIYNAYDFSVDRMIFLGVVCTYLAIIATIFDLMEVLISIAQVIFQKVRGSNKIGSSSQGPTSNKKKIHCRIGDRSQYSQSFKTPNSKKNKTQKNHHPEASLNNSQMIPLNSNETFINGSKAEQKISPEQEPKAEAPLKTKNRINPYRYQLQNQDSETKKKEESKLLKESLGKIRKSRIEPQNALQISNSQEGRDKEPRPGIQKILNRRNKQKQESDMSEIVSIQDDA